MRILHTADLHLGQVIYRHYDRADEHAHFFSQLSRIIADHRPDVFVVSGDVFDIQQPSATSWKAFNSHFVALRRTFPDLHIVVVAGNHDSASRINSHTEVWDLSGVKLVGTPPPLDFADTKGWEDNYVVRLPEGFVIALPYMTGNRPEVGIALQDYVSRINTGGLPVVMTGHLAVAGSDTEGHDINIGTLNALPLERLGSGYDYLALGHIHKPQTLTHNSGMNPEYEMATTVHYAPVARYSGSPIHISGDEAYPHSVSVVDIDRHGGRVTINRIRIDQLRHFHIIPEGEALVSEKEALKLLKKFAEEHNGAYIRFKLSTKADLSPDFDSKVYNIIETGAKDIRYNPKALWVSPAEEENSEPEAAPTFEVSELQQMANPLEFVQRTFERYPAIAGIDLDEAFAEIEEEIRRMDEEEHSKTRKTASR